MSTVYKKELGHEAFRISSILFDGHHYLAEVMHPENCKRIELSKKQFDELEDHFEHFEFVTLDVDHGYINAQGILYPDHLKVIDEEWEWR